VLPILDSLPLYVAEAEGYLVEAGVEVEFIAAASAAERDQLLQAGQADLVITDLVALALYNREANEVIAVRYAMVPTASSAQFRVLASGASGHRTPADLAGVAVGVSEGTVIEYVTNRLLSAEGLAEEDLAVVAVPRIPERMALLAEGELAAATLPEPLGSLALQQGATLIVDDTAHPEVSCSIYAVRASVLAARPEAIRGLLDAVDRASVAINADQARWSSLLVEKELIPPPLQGSYTLPEYPVAGVPTATQYADVVAWLAEAKGVTGLPSHESIIDVATGED
jgi:NitT/TauT family transport system substrate-binding protein